VPGLASFAGSNPATAEWRYHLTDHLGSVRQLTGQTKAALARYDYAPYGELLRSAGLLLTVGYTGHLWDNAIGQYYAPFRYYNPQTARWNMRDPLGFVDGPNVYAYVAGNPVNEYDPLGLSTAAGVCMIAIGPSLPSLSSTISVLVVGAGVIGGVLTAPVSVPVVVAGVLVGATAGAIIGINIYAKQTKGGGRKPKNDLPTNVREEMRRKPKRPDENGRKYADRLFPDENDRGPGSDHSKLQKFIDSIARINNRKPCK
ncbi:MAG: RHS repeat-associated core domain-containing protein, partial [Candidatus Hydrogenedentes bacterium]|nr:RHS repeat-associated core domain-containing protein [Candidatus Hydrogenedentota bacterium]